jgi:hypothetical protein
LGNLRAMAQEQFIFRALRQQMLWPSIHSAVEVYQRRRASAADYYELIWRLIHICECTVITLASASISRLREMGENQEYLKLRERCYGITWNSTEASLEKGLGSLDGSIDKWIEIIQYVSGLDIEDNPKLQTADVLLLFKFRDSRLQFLIRRFGHMCCSLQGNTILIFRMIRSAH